MEKIERGMEWNSPTLFRINTSWTNAGGSLGESFEYHYGFGWRSVAWYWGRNFVWGLSNLLHLLLFINRKWALICVHGCINKMLCTFISATINFINTDRLSIAILEYSFISINGQPLACSICSIAWNVFSFTRNDTSITWIDNQLQLMTIIYTKAKIG